MAIAAAVTAIAVAVAQAPPAPPPPVVVGRDSRERAQVIGKEFALRVRLLDVAGAGVQQIRVVRVGEDGNITLPRIAPLKAAGVPIATVEAQATAAYKAIVPTAAAYISIADRNPPTPATTQMVTQPAATTVAAAAASQAATAPAK